MRGYTPNWEMHPSFLQMHGRPVITDPNSAAYGAGGFDWGKVRLNLGYAGQEPGPPIEDNVVYLETPEQDNTMLYVLGGVAGLLGLLLIFRR